MQTPNSPPIQCQAGTHHEELLTRFTAPQLIICGLVAYNFFMGKRVFILGAGFSKGMANVPIASELFASTNEFARKHDSEEWKTALEILADLSPNFDASKVDEIDVEDCLSLLDAFIFIYKQFNDDDSSPAKLTANRVVLNGNQRTGWYRGCNLPGKI